MSNSIWNVDYTRSLPPSLKKDEDFLALGKVVSDYMEEISSKYYLTIIYARIDELPEKVIDILAYDFHVDWYDYRLPLDKKREVLKNSIQVHKHLGTRYAVETVLKAVYEKVTILEWFEEDTMGRPYTFKLALDASDTGVSQEIQQEMLKQLYSYKNLRSHLDSIGIVLEEKGNMYLGAVGQQSVELSIAPLFIPPEQKGVVYVGAAGQQTQELEVRPLQALPEQTGKMYFTGYGEMSQTLNVRSKTEG